MIWEVRRVPHPEAADLADLVDDPDGFRDSDLFARARLTSGGPGHVQRFGSTDQLWDDLLGRGIRQPAYRLVNNGTTLAASASTRTAGMGNRNLTDVVAPNQLIDAYRDGATVSLQGLHHTDPRMARLACNLALALDHPVQVNAYLSPPNTRGLDLHFDWHDVFVVQLGGSKRWRIWEPLARTRQPVRGRSIKRPKLAELGAPLLDVELHPGDRLYLPRGFPHAAETVEVASEHLTIGLVSVNWSRVVRAAVDAAVKSGEFSSSLAARLLDSGTSSLAAPLALTVPNLDPIIHHLDPAAIRHWLACEIWRKQPATRWKPRHEVGMNDAPIRFTPGPLLWVTESGNRTVMGLGDRQLTIPIEATPFVIDLLRRPDGFTPDEPRGLDPQSVEVVLTRLINEGVLVQEAPCS